MIMGKEKGIPEGWRRKWLHLYKTVSVPVTFKVLFDYMAKTNYLKEIPDLVAMTHCFWDMSF